MWELEKIFDTYSFNARVKPALLLVFPSVIALFVLYEPSRSWGGAAMTFIISFGIISFAVNQMSTHGNLLQERLIGKWGGLPTTIILRNSDSRLDRHTKYRYMVRLEQLIPNFSIVSADEERDDPYEADQLYQTAANYLKEHTRDTEKYPLIFKENVLYGFSRNTRAFKSLGIVIDLLTLFLSIFVIYQKVNKDNVSSFSELIFHIPVEHIALVILLIVLLLIWIFFVTEKWVSIRAFAYAKALFASCEELV